jgi:tRNA nucleotidyltransferase/poly(A) polymerase
VEDKVFVQWICQGKHEEEFEEITRMTPETLRMIREDWNAISRKKLGEEFLKIIASPSPDYGFQLLLDTGLMQCWITDAIKGSKYEGKLSPFSMEQNNRFHTLTLDQHTCQTLKHSLPLHADAPLEKQTIMRLTAIFHDFGKMYLPLQRPNNSGATSYHGHEVHSAALTQLCLSYLELDSYIPPVKSLVRHHMRPHSLAKESSARAVSKLLKDLANEGVSWVDLLNQAEADMKAKSMVLGPNEAAYLIELNKLRQKIKFMEKQLVEKSAKIKEQETVMTPQEFSKLLTSLPRKEQGKAWRLYKASGPDDAVLFVRMLEEQRQDL